LSSVPFGSLFGATFVDDHIRVENRAQLEPGEFARLEAKLTAQRSVRHVLDWLPRHEPSLKMEDMVTQDEFSHDILVPYEQDSIWSTIPPDSES
jgi:hypothetical protein